jgi:fatty acid desaturase
MRHRADVSTLLVLVVAGVALVTPYAAELSAAQGAAFFCLNVFFGLVVHVINHNVSHCPLFESDRANQLSSYGLTSLLGIPAAAISASHIYNHHVHNNDENDWLRSTVLQETQGPLRLVKYVVHVFSLPRLSQRPGAEAIPFQLKRQIRFETFFVLGVLLAAFMLAPQVTLIYFVATRLCAMSCLFVLNLVQHDGLERETGVNRCHNYTGRVVNFVLFKNGYHSAHHLRPGAHWSELDQLHNSMVAPLAKPSLQHKSLLGFVWGSYLRP